MAVTGTTPQIRGERSPDLGVRKTSHDRAGAGGSSNVKPQACFGVPAICGFLGLSAIHAGALRLLGDALYNHAEEARALASVVAAAIVPVAVGAVMLRMSTRVLAEPALRSSP